jgi:hypothetical protein
MARASGPFRLSACFDKSAIRQAWAIIKKDRTFDLKFVAFIDGLVGAPRSARQIPAILCFEMLARKQQEPPTRARPGVEWQSSVVIASCCGISANRKRDCHLA